MQGDEFAQGLVPPRLEPRVAAVLDALMDQGTRWPGLDDPLREELHRFDAQHFTAAFARACGGEVATIERRQDFLVRTAVTSILFPLEAFEDRLLRLIETRGLKSLWHHLLRELVDAGAEQEPLFEASGACRVAAFALDDLAAEAAKEDLTPAEIVQAWNTIRSMLIQRSDPSQLEYGDEGLALLWVTSAIGLGGLNDTSTTEHYSEW